MDDKKASVPCTRFSGGGLVGVGSFPLAIVVTPVPMGGGIAGPTIRFRFGGGMTISGTALFGDVDVAEELSSTVDAALRTFGGGGSMEKESTGRLGGGNIFLFNVCGGAIVWGSRRSDGCGGAGFP